MLNIEKKSFQTALGEIVLSGTFDGTGPFVVVIRGAYATEDQYSQLPTLLPKARVVFGDIPGMRSPRLTTQTVDAFCAAYSQALDQLPGKVVVCGVSLGGLISLGLDASTIFALVAVDPPLQPSASASLRKAIAAAFHESEDPYEREYLTNVFGAGEKGFYRVDYRQMVDRVRYPTCILTGDGKGEAPSVLSDTDIKCLEAHELVIVERISGVGHAVHRGGSDRILAAIVQLLPS